MPEHALQGSKPTMPRLVIFDLDGTLIREQTQQLLLNYLWKQGVVGIVPFCRLLVWFVCYKIGIITEPYRVMHYAYSFLKGMPEEDFTAHLKRFFEREISPRLTASGRALVASHLAQGDHLLLVSNTIQPIARFTAEHLRMAGHLATLLEICNGKLTGKLGTSPVYGAEKSRLIQEYAKRNCLMLATSSAYCDHYSDLPVLEMVATAVAVNPDHKLEAIAQAAQWQVMQLY